MKVLKIEDDQLKQACQNLKEANEALGRANKTAKGAKAIIEKKLYELRELNLETVPIGEIVTVEKLLLIEIGKQNRFDDEQFELDHPELYQSYKKDFRCKKFKPLL